MPYGYEQDPLEGMYPEEYNEVYPRVVERANRYFNDYGPYHEPNREMIGNMAGEIVEGLGGGYRQYGPGGILGTLATVLLVRELIDRRRPYRRRHHYPGYGHYPGGYHY